MRRLFSFLIMLSCVMTVLIAQPQHSLKGIVIDKHSRQPLEFINVQVMGLSKGAVTDANGQFAITSVPPGIYRLQASAIGYQTNLTPEYILSGKDLYVSIEIEENLTELEGVTVTSSPIRRNIESPVGLRIIGLQEIEKSPGANRDISRIVQSYPGVGFSPIGYRNDLIVRGGGPSENRFYLDGVEIPNINHFSTQGASGGPVGIINADLIREVNFYSGAFPGYSNNALSSVIDFKLRDGNMDRNSLKATLGASEVSLSSNGHLSEKTSYLVSVRQSYLQFLFDQLGLPFLPTFTDAQFKIKTRLNAYNELTVLGLGGIDQMKLNTKADDEDNQYILSYLPKIQQETFTLGAVYRHYAGAHVQTVVVSHNYLNNRNTKFLNNDESLPENLILRLRSVEQDTKLRLENTSSFRNWKINIGANLNYTQYTNTTFQRVFIRSGQTYDYHTYLGILHWGLFGTINYTSQDERFTASLGLRADANNHAAAMKQLSDQLSPRLSLSYRLTEQLSASGSAGLYYQLPPYTGMGFKDSHDRLINKQLSYMSVSQFSAGLSWQKNNMFELTVEGFYKDYNKVPVSIADGIPLTCKGNDYGVVGNEALASTAQGRSYGVELLFKWLIAQKLNLASSITLFKSEYRTNKESEYINSAWDNRFIFNVRGTYNLPRNWSVGMKISCIGGAPYTPYDVDKSSLVTAWDAQAKPYYDYSRYNEERLSTFAQADIRIDKTFYLKHCMLGFYIDLQNITASKLKQADVLMSTGVIANPEAPQAERRYNMKSIKQDSGTLLPTLGITFEY